MPSTMEIIWYDGIGDNIDKLMFYSEEHAQEVFDLGAQTIQDKAQNEAPWEDRTGAARAGLTAEVYDDLGELVIELYHTVDYGQWLELIQDGRFAIIMPTLEQVGPEILLEAGASVVGLGM